MQIADAQRDVREVYAGGAPGQLVSAVLWLAAATLATVVSPTAGIVALLLGGVAILPVTMLVLRLGGGPSSLPRGHPMAPLAVQIAFTVPLGLLVAVAAAGYQLDWFFPASMLIVGAHYLPFTFLYGTPIFAGLGAAMCLGAITLALWLPLGFAAGGWITAAMLVVAAGLLHRSHRRRSADAPTPPSGAG